MSQAKDAIKHQKADLHVHLNGAVPTELVKELVSRYRVPIPDGFDLSADLQIQSPVTSLIEYFRPWFLLKRLPIGRKCLHEMVFGALQSMKNDNISYVELRNSPFNIAEINDISLDQTMRWMVETVQDCSADLGIDARLIISISRFRFDEGRAQKLLKAMGRFRDSGVIVGIDLSGDETAALPDTVSKLFREAKGEYGFGVTIHAGETGIRENVEWAIVECNADRIGHALAAAKSERLLESILEKGICIETCLTSNLLTGSVRSIEEHPVSIFLDSDVPIVLCTDNPAIHGRSLSAEYELFSRAFSAPRSLEKIYENHKHYSFAR